VRDTSSDTLYALMYAQIRPNNLECYGSHRVDGPEQRGCTTKVERGACSDRYAGDQDTSSSEGEEQPGGGVFELIEESPTRRTDLAGAVEGTRSSRPRWWLIVKNENGRVRFLTMDWGGEEALAVFGHQEEAEIFLQVGGYGGGWQARESTTGEVVSVLWGPCAGAESVALDPLPRMVADGMLGLVRMERGRFLEQLVGGAGQADHPYMLRR
jgi:hypothetical protein